MSRIEKVEEEMQTLAIKELDKLIGESLWDLKPSLNLLSWDVARDGSIIATGETRLLALKNAIERLRDRNEEEEYEIVDHPQHYGGAEARHEAISVIEEWDLGFHLGNVVKYISRAGKKPDQTTISDLKKARWYLDRYIERMENK
jgi:hypothetical protein